MERALVVCEQSAAQALVRLLKGMDITLVDTCLTANDARQRFQYMEYDLVLLNAPLKDEFGIELAADLEEGHDSSIVMLVPNEMFEGVQQKLEPQGVLCMAKPLNKQLLVQAVRALGSVRLTVQRLKEENRKLTQKLQDVRMVNRAKFCLIQVLKMSEESAHRYIQKQAMDLRITQRAAAENILKTYEM